MNEPIVTAEDLLLEVGELLNFPFSQICRHAVVLNLLSLLEKRGWKCSQALAKAVCDADDATAMRELGYDWDPGTRKWRKIII
jgi:hypothetical protein